MRTILATIQATAILALVLVTTFTGCDSSSTSPDGAAGEDGGSQADGASSDGQSNTDAGGPGSDAAASSDADAASTSDAASLIEPDGSYVWDTWTCGQNGTTKDIKAFAMGLGIQSVVTKFAGATGSVDVVYSGTCTRTTTFTVEYPTSDTIKTTAAGTFTCSPGCAPAQCTAGSQAVIVDTFTHSASGSTYTYTRLLDAAYLMNVTLQKAAGCAEGDTETATRIKQ